MTTVHFIHVFMHYVSHCMLYRSENYRRNRNIASLKLLSMQGLPSWIVQTVLWVPPSCSIPGLPSMWHTKLVRAYSCLQCDTHSKAKTVLLFLCCLIYSMASVKQRDLDNWRGNEQVEKVCPPYHGGILYSIKNGWSKFVHLLLIWVCQF